MKRSSLQWRITVGLAVSLAALFSLQLWMAAASARRAVENGISQNLEHEIENLLSALVVTKDSVSLRPDAETMIYRRVYSGHYFAILHKAGEIRSRSLWDGELPPQPKGLHRIPGPKGQTLLAKTASFSKGGWSIAITAAEDVSEADAEIASFRGQYAGVAVLTLVALLALQAVIVRMALAPVERARLEAVRLERGETSRLDTEVPAELAPFTAQLNRLTAIAHKRLIRSRAAMGDLAHALKTPLAAIRQAAENEKVKGDEELYHLLGESADKMSRLMDKELRKARLAGGVTPGAGFDAERDIPPLLKTLEIMYREKGVRVEAAIAAGALTGYDSADMMELLGTLLDNACKWARTRVALRLTMDERFTIAIEDDGPGIPPEAAEQIAGRGVRLDESVPGHGLGLAIARDIVESYGGELRFDCSPELGGLRVAAVFPLQK